MQNLIVKVKGAVTESNFDEYKHHLIAQIKSANKELETDDDFVEAEGTVKQLQDAEKALIKTKSDALEQAEEVQRIFEAIDEVTEEARQARLNLQRQIKQRKEEEEIKRKLMDSYYVDCEREYDAHYECNNDFKLVAPQIEGFNTDYFNNQIKGKRTLKSIESALDEYSSIIKERITYEVEKIDENRQIINNIAPEHKSLFQDEKALLATNTELLSEIIARRIAIHETEELKRKQMDAERAETAKIEAEKQQQEAEKELEPEIDEPEFRNNTEDKQEETITKFVLCIKMNKEINKVILVGKLGQDPLFRYANNGNAIANLNVTTSESWEDKNTGEKRERVEGHRVILFNRLGEMASQYLKKGSQVRIEGKLQTRMWRDNNGEARYTTEIIANEIQMVAGDIVISTNDSTPFQKNEQRS